MKKQKKSAGKKQAKQASYGKAFYTQEEIAAMLSDWATLYAKAVHVGLGVLATAGGQDEDHPAQVLVTTLTKGHEEQLDRTAVALLADGAQGLGILLGGALTEKHPTT